MTDNIERRTMKAAINVFSDYYDGIKAEGIAKGLSADEAENRAYQAMRDAVWGRKAQPNS